MTQKFSIGWPPGFVPQLAPQYGRNTDAKRSAGATATVEKRRARGDMDIIDMAGKPSKPSTFVRRDPASPKPAHQQIQISKVDTPEEAGRRDAKKRRAI